MIVRAAATSSGAQSPFIASITPPGSRSGRSQRASRSIGATARAVATVALEPSVHLLCSPAHDFGRRQPERRSSLSQPDDPPVHRLEKDNPQIRAHAGQHDAGEPGTTANIDDGALGGQEGGNGRRVEDVAFPDPRDLTRADESPGDAFLGEHRGEGGQAGIGITECRSQIWLDVLSRFRSRAHHPGSQGLGRSPPERSCSAHQVGWRHVTGSALFSNPGETVHQQQQVGGEGASPRGSRCSGWRLRRAPPKRHGRWRRPPDAF